MVSLGASKLLFPFYNRLLCLYLVPLQLPFVEYLFVLIFLPIGLTMSLLLILLISNNYQIYCFSVTRIPVYNHNLHYVVRSSNYPIYLYYPYLISMLHTIFLGYPLFLLKTLHSNTLNIS